MRFLIFNVEKDYEQGTLTDHLNYLREWGGSPDCLDTASTIKEATCKKRQTNFESIIYDNHSGKVFKT